MTPTEIVPHLADRPAAPPYRVLSLDGGGMRGVYTAAFLDRLVRYYASIRKVESLDLGRGFDLIVGTSTGAIVGCAAAVGRPMCEVVDLYRKHGRQIFPHHIVDERAAIYRAFRGDRFVRSGDAAMRAALRNVLGETTMKDVFETRGIALSIPAVSMSQHRAWVFKKTASSGVRDDNYTLADVCLATTAAPVYRSLAALNDPNAEHGVPQIFADGGLWANNPVLVALIDALYSAPKGREIQIFSLGTCPRPEGEHIPASEVHRSMLGWYFGARVAPLSISAQEFAFDNMARMLANFFTELGRPVRRLRFPSRPVPAEMMKFLDLDDTRPEAIERLINQAAHDADTTKSACDDPKSVDGALIRELFLSIPAMPKSGTSA